MRKKEKAMLKEQEILQYHSQGRKGKIEVVATKSCVTQRDLSIAYSPGVAVPCLHIQKNPEDAYNYTAKGNLVAVVSNGTAVLGLGDIGALAGKPVMEGKGVLFKRFADIDVFDLEINSHDPDEIIKVVQLLEPTFGGINLEDIKAPECFYIEEKLKQTMTIPVFHDDQHGTAIISGAALLNALEVVGKKIGQIKLVVNGAGASGIACTNFYISLGVKRENIILCDTKGVIYKGRKTGMNPYKESLAVETGCRTLADAMVKADVFAGLSVANCVTKEMVRSMNTDPIIFAMANPDPEITFEEAQAARSDVIMATGRSDYPNQVNNVLGFPFIFRGALDVRASTINEEMKRAAAMALAALTKEDVPDSVAKVYGKDRLHFGRDYLIPKPFDYRVLIWEAAAVAKAAMDTGVARTKVDIEEYKEQLENRLGKSREVMRSMFHVAKSFPKRVVFPEGANEKILRASHIIVDEGIAHPVLLGKEEIIRQAAKELDIDLSGVEIIHPTTSADFEAYAQTYYKLRQRKGLTYNEAIQQMRNGNYYGAMMVHTGRADALIAGVTQNYPETIRPALQIVQMQEGLSTVSGLYVLLIKNKIYFIADPAVNIDPTAEELAQIAISSANVARRFNVDPRVAMISFSNFGSTKHALTDKVKEAVQLTKRRDPDLMVDGEMMADTAVVPEIIEKDYPFSTLKGGANVLIFPEIQSANAAYKLLYRLGGAEIIGPVLMGMKHPVHVLQRGCEVNDIVNMTAIAVVEARR
jgi:malate dehydrogenase (oxaloacetate-decarboxylating)(NADP+)